MTTSPQCSEKLIASPPRSSRCPSEELSSPPRFFARPHPIRQAERSVHSREDKRREGPCRIRDRARGVLNCPESLPQLDTPDPARFCQSHSSRVSASAYSVRPLDAATNSWSDYPPRG